jgi:hypothetical protein
MTHNQSYYIVMGNATSAVLSDGTTITVDGAFIAPGTGITLNGPPGFAWTGFLYTQVPFVVEKFVLLNGIVYARDFNGNIYQYGGSDGDTYDHCPVQVETPWLDGKKPGTRKQGTNVDISMSGNWFTKAAMDYKTSPTPYKVICTRSSPTFDPQSFPYSMEGTHFKIRSTTSDAIQAVLSALLFHYNDAGETK